MSYGQYRAILATRREQSDRAAAFRALHETYQNSLNTYATLYNGVCQRDWFQARARGYESTLDAALHGDNIPTSVVENLIETTRAGVEPLRATTGCAARRSACRRITSTTISIPLVTFDKKYEYDDVLDWIVESVAPLGPEYQARMREGFAGGWIDVYENDGKRSGAYSAPVYGTHPYMLLNYTDTLDDMFTLAHEMGHSMHTILSHEAQPFVYSSYTIFVAEVPSTLSEALLLEYLLARSTDPAERVVLLQHAIDNITGTFYTQVLFADYELRAHRLAEQDQPITAEILTETYRDAARPTTTATRSTSNEQTGITWSRIPHFFNSPYYVYQYATCFASAARLAQRDHARHRGVAARGARAVPDAPALGRQRLPDGAAEEGRRRSEPARHRPRDRQAAGRSGDAAREGAGGAGVSRRSWRTSLRVASRGLEAATLSRDSEPLREKRKRTACGLLT